MSKIAPGGDPISDASQQAAQQMVQAAKAAKAAQEAANPGTSVGSASHMKFAAQKIIHTPETPADYQKRLDNDKKHKGLHVPGEN